jgi:hypothetical protein
MDSRLRGNDRLTRFTGRPVRSRLIPRFRTGLPIPSPLASRRSREGGSPVAARATCRSVACCRLPRFDERTGMDAHLLGNDSFTHGTERPPPSHFQPRRSREGGSPVAARAACRSVACCRLSRFDERTGMDARLRGNDNLKRNTEYPIPSHLPTRRSREGGSPAAARAAPRSAAGLTLSSCRRRRGGASANPTSKPAARISGRRAPRVLRS